jgi:hypothetical protein
MREVVEVHRCRCVLVATDPDINHVDHCGSSVSSDQPFCAACEDRHPGMLNAEVAAMGFDGRLDLER